MKLYSIIIISILLSFPLKGQDNKKKNVRQSMGCGGFTIGYGSMDISKLQVFVPSGMGNFRNDQLLIGGTGHGIINKFVIGGSGFGITGDVLKSDSMKASLSGGMGTFDLGYMIVNRRHIKVYPMLGIGGHGYGMQITRTGGISANHVAQKPNQEINISHGGFAADISININIIPSLEYDEKDQSYGGFMTGLKVGYLFSLPSSDWKYSGGDISGGPYFGLNMFYMKLIIGGFGYQEK